MKSSARDIVRDFLASCDITVDGGRQWDIRVLDERFYGALLASRSLGLGESYMNGWWHADAVEETIAKILRAKAHDIAPSPRDMLAVLLARLVNLQSKGSRAQQVIDQHYDLGNRLFTQMLDPKMVYTCGYWERAKNLAEAQIAKMDLVCKKIGLKKGDKILDIGCGFGSFAKYAAETYGASVVGITLSREQKSYADASTNGLPIEIRIQDYRDLNERFDHIVSIGMFEAVGYKNFRTYMETVHRCLKDGGLFLLHTIGQNVSTTVGDPWSHKYIFKNGMLPSVMQLGTSIEGLFVMEDWHNFGTDYVKTLLAWHDNFTEHWDELRNQYGERFRRMWEYYLLSFAGAFKARYIQLWQIVLSKGGLEGGYRRPLL